MFTKLNTYFWYLYEYMKHGDFLSIYASVKYLIFKRSHKKDRIIQTSVGKFFCRKNTNDFQFANFRYEWGVKNFILKHINEYSVFIDSGSCIGEYSVLLSKYNIRCIAFEPLAKNYEVLVTNLQMNNLIDKVMTIPAALGNENKPVRFKFNRINTGASCIDLENKPDSFQVELRTFDSLLTKFNIGKDEHILFKLDVEGMEAEALQGSANFIRQYPHITYILEEKFTGRALIQSILDKLGRFEYGMVDKLNMYARKV